VEAWQHIWREGIAPVLSVRGLEVLRRALVADDAALGQGVTARNEADNLDAPPEVACPLGYAGWQGESLATVQDAEDWFAWVCGQIDRRLKDPFSCRWFMQFWDNTPRPEARRQLLIEVERSLARRLQGEDGAS